jgi:hypothetical protein
MNDNMMQGGLWIAAGFLLLMMLGRRRKRRVER